MENNQSNNVNQPVNNQNVQNGAEKTQKKKHTGLIVLLVILVVLIPIILFSVMMVSTGVLIYNQATTNVEDMAKQMDSLQTQAFNQMFESYLGDNKSKSEVIALSERVKENNKYSENIVSVTYKLKDGTTYSLENFDNSLPTARYNISGTKNDKGYIDNILIVEQEGVSTN